MHFARPDTETFRGLEICREAMRRGGLAPAAANGANEKAVELFLKDKIAFLDIAELVGEAMERQPKVDSYTIEDVIAADEAAKRYVSERVE